MYSLFAFIATFLFSSPAFSQVLESKINPEPIVKTISEQISPIAAVGGAVLLVVVAVSAFRWVRAALR